MSTETATPPPQADEQPAQPSPNRPDLNGATLIAAFNAAWENFTSANSEHEFSEREKALCSNFFGAGVEFFQGRYNSFSEDKWLPILDARPQQPYLVLDARTRQVTVGMKALDGRWLVPLDGMRPTHYALLPPMPEALKELIRSGIITPSGEPPGRIIVPGQ